MVRYKDLSQEAKKRKIAAVQVNRRKKAAMVAALKASQPCTDCGGLYPAHVMQFDHVRGEKAFNISKVTTTNISLERLEQEIAKCDVVCANCHAVRTHTRRWSVG